MTDQEAAGVSADAQDVSMPESLTLEAAAELLDREPVEQVEAGAQPVADDALVEEQVATEDAEDDTDPAHEAEPAESDASEKEAHGNIFVNLRNGERVRVADLKKEIDEAREIKARVPILEAENQKFKAFEQRAAQQAQFFDQTVGAALAVLQSRLPKPPDPSLREADPVEFFLQRDRYDEQLREVQQIGQRIQAARIESERRAQAERAAMETQHARALEQEVARNQSELLRKIPELTAPEGRARFEKTIRQIGAHYGFADSEIGKVFDHRILLMARDAAAYHEAKKSAQTKVVKPNAGATPTQQPQRRVTTSEAASADRSRKLAQAARKPGGLSLEEAAALI